MTDRAAAVPMGEMFRGDTMRIDRIIQDKGGDVVTIAPGATVGDAAKLLSDKHIGAVIVCDDGKALQAFCPCGTSSRISAGTGRRCWSKKCPS